MSGFIIDFDLLGELSMNEWLTEMDQTEDRKKETERLKLMRLKSWKNPETIM